MSHKSKNSERLNKNSQSNTPPSNGSKRIEFALEAPAAASVLLVADFTEWERRPVQMSKSENGLWKTEVPLAGGMYSYRFIVDGEWQDDPGSLERIPNPFGTMNCTKQV
jgi:1,4-alpha-glucan branching enzyme